MKPEFDIHYNTSVTVSRRNLEDFCWVWNFNLSHMIIYFAANNLDLNLNKENERNEIHKK